MYLSNMFFEVFYQHAVVNLFLFAYSVVLYSLTRATLMSPGQDETRVCGYIVHI